MDFISLLKEKKYVVIDGAMGTQLEHRGATAGPAANVKSPETVLEIHRDYIAAGAHAIISNTFCMNRIYMESHKVSLDLEEVNRAGVELARKAAGGAVCVMGEVGLTGQMLEPLGAYTEAMVEESILEQVKIVAAAGVDAFIIETATDLRELLCAVKVCRENFKLPIVASLTYSTEQNGGRTMMGNKAADSAAALEQAGATVLGLNCGEIDPKFAYKIVEFYKSASGLPVMVEPNAGKPRVEGVRTVYDMPPDIFAAEVIRPCIEAGAKIVGGCCGTTPAHIREAARLAASL